MERCQGRSRIKTIPERQQNWVSVFSGWIGEEENEKVSVSVCVNDTVLLRC